MKHQLPSMDREETIGGFVLLFAQLFIIPLAVLLICEIAGMSLSVAAKNFLCFAANFICAIVIFRRYWLSSLKEMSGKRFSLLKTAATYFGLYYAGMILINILIFSLDPDFTNANDNAIAAMSEESSLLMAVGVVLLVPPVEEILYRGIVFSKLYARSPILAYLVSIAVFAAIHVVAYIGSVTPFRLLLCFLQYIPAGFCLARAYVVSGSIFAPILIHATINFITVLSM